MRRACHWVAAFVSIDNAAFVDYLKTIPCDRPGLTAMADLLTLAEMAKSLSVSPKTLKKYVVERSIPHIAVGRSMRFDASVVRSHLHRIVEPSQNSVEFKKPANTKRTPSKFAAMVGV